MFGGPPNPYVIPGAPVYGMPPQAPPNFPVAGPPGWPQQPTAQPKQTLPPPPPSGLAAANPPAGQAKPKARAASPDPTPPVPPPLPAPPPAAPPAPTRVVLPSPEELGIKVGVPAPAPAAVVAALDWNQIHARLEQLGVIHFQRDRLPQGGFRVTCSLPTGTPAQAHQVEAVAATESAAVLDALQRAEAWSTARK
jgi:hypothetical protein